MFLSVEYSHEDVAEARKGETTCSCPLGRPVQAAQIKQVEPAASTCHAHGLARVGCGVVEAVLVHMEGVEEVGLPPVSVPGAAGEGGVQVKGCLLHSGGPHLWQILEQTLLKRTAVKIIERENLGRFFTTRFSLR
jgi:hypothetical protein